jgi:hypothetical protein
MDLAVAQEHGSTATKRGMRARDARPAGICEKYLLDTNVLLRFCLTII